MPENTDSFTDGLWYVIKNAVSEIKPEISEAGNICAALIGITVLVFLTNQFFEKNNNISELVGCLLICGILLRASNTLILLGINTVKEITDYGNLLIPVLTGALAAQGGITSSAALFAGTSFFSSLLSMGLSFALRPMLYIFLALSVTKSISTDSFLNKLLDLIKWLFTWGLKISLYVFTGYMGVTGVISGSVDAAKLKATKLTISGMVPVIGGILSDASESVLLSAGVLKNSTGIYGLIAIAAILMEPFLKIGCQYLLLKVTDAVCQVFECKRINCIIGAFTSAMGFVMALIGSVCIMLLVSIVCFMKVVS